ncbi:MAG TPA: hypothetical protein VK735_40345 [Pseudonocardia sp.]|uniref:hypothetical protein n=1 Tax=Pseudonocardia sp. TaxID=60912 RepID=UPI002C33466B|nr:hypothetical protein [Pseudonocardia sp.]HTF53737.1 hypothetical protein [Pseudonocardia sp.]
MKSRSVLILGLSMFGLIGSGLALSAVVVWLRATEPSDLLGILLAFAGAFGGLALSRLWAVRTAEHIDYTQTRADRGVSFSAKITPGDDVPAYILLGAGAAQIAGAIALVAAAQLGVVGAGAMCLMGVFMLNWCRSSWRRTDQPPKP